MEKVGEDEIENDLLPRAQRFVRQRPEGGRLAEQVGDDQEDGHLLEQGENEFHGRSVGRGKASGTAILVISRAVFN